MNGNHFQDWPDILFEEGLRSVFSQQDIPENLTRRIDRALDRENEPVYRPEASGPVHPGVVRTP